jgi:hypothetical protein
MLALASLRAVVQARTTPKHHHVSLMGVLHCSLLAIFNLPSQASMQIQKQHYRLHPPFAHSSFQSIGGGRAVPRFFASKTAIAVSNCASKVAKWVLYLRKA